MWKQLFGKSKKENEDPILPHLPLSFKQMLSQALGKNAIPAMPQSAQRVFTVVVDPDSEAYDFVEAIEGDEGLASRIIKIANSVYFDRGSGSESVVEAVATIGTKELRNILGATSLQGLFPSSHSLRAELWEHNLAVGVLSRELAARKLPGKENEAFLGGLLHDIGKLLLLELDPSRYSEIVKKAGRSGNFCQEEEEVYPFNHAELGHYIAERWNFSEALMSAIRLHHLPTEDLNPHSLPFLVKTADLISHKLKIGFSSGLTNLQNNAAIKVLECFDLLGISNEDAQGLMKDLNMQFQEEKERLEL